MNQLKGSSLFSVPNFAPNSEEKFLVFLSAIGGRVTDPVQQLEVNTSDRITFEVEVLNGVSELELLVQYIYRGNNVGHARKSLPCRGFREEITD